MSPPLPAAPGQQDREDLAGPAVELEGPAALRRTAYLPVWQGGLSTRPLIRTLASMDINESRGAVLDSAPKRWKVA